jgi:anti-sigma factor RsiW
VRLLTCQEVLDFLSDYVAGRLSAVEAARMDEHLALCPECIAYLANFKATLAACQKLRETDLQKLGPLPEDLVQAILASRES